MLANHKLYLQEDMWQETPLGYFVTSSKCMCFISIKNLTLLLKFETVAIHYVWYISDGNLYHKDAEVLAHPKTFCI